MKIWHGPDWLPAVPATERQTQRLRELAPEVSEQAALYVERRLAEGMDEQEAWMLLGELGARIMTQGDADD